MSDPTSTDEARPARIPASRYLWLGVGLAAAGLVWQSLFFGYVVATRDAFAAIFFVISLVVTVPLTLAAGLPSVIWTLRTRNAAKTAMWTTLAIAGAQALETAILAAMKIHGPC